MKEVKCKCGTVVLRGEIKRNHSNRIVFVPDGKPKGIILTGGSSDPNRWKAVCSNCQKNR